MLSRQLPARICATRSARTRRRRRSRCIILTTLALGIGASTAIFSMVNGILLQPLPLQDPDRLLYITEVNPRGTLMTVSWPNYLDWRARPRSFERLACSREERVHADRHRARATPHRPARDGEFLPGRRRAPAIGRGIHG